MPIKIPNTLPATKILESENIFVMSEQRAQTQDIRPLRLVVLNLMPKKIDTETQLLRILSNTPVQIDLELMQISGHQSKNTSGEHLLKFYNTFDALKNQRFDGMIVTGAPVELLPFEAVDYWDELCHIMEWSKTNVYSTMHICWGAQAALFYHYGVKKVELPQKMFGVFQHQVLNRRHRLLRGFDEDFVVPHSRHTTVHREELEKVEDLEILTYSEEAGVHCAASRDNRLFFVTGHGEYERNTLAEEYFRDKEKGLSTALPLHYFPNDNPALRPRLNWRAHSSLLFCNWLNYFVYQETPYDLSQLGSKESKE